MQTDRSTNKQTISGSYAKELANKQQIVIFIEDSALHVDQNKLAHVENSISLAT